MEKIGAAEQPLVSFDPKAFLVINETQEEIGKGFDSPGGFAVNKV